MLWSAGLIPIGLLLVWKPDNPAHNPDHQREPVCPNSWKTNLVTMTVDIFPRSVIGRVHSLVAAGGGIGGR